MATASAVVAAAPASSVEANTRQFLTLLYGGEAEDGPREALAFLESLQPGCTAIDVPLPPPTTPSASPAFTASVAVVVSAPAPAPAPPVTAPPPVPPPLPIDTSSAQCSLYGGGDVAPSAGLHALLEWIAYGDDVVTGAPDDAAASAALRLAFHVLLASGGVRHVNGVDERGHSALMLAIAHGKTAHMRLLMDVPRIDCDVRGAHDSATALRLALVLHPPDSARVTTADLTRLIRASAADTLNVALRPSADALGGGDTGGAPLHLCVAQGRWTAVLELLERVPALDLDVTDADGRTAEQLLTCARTGVGAATTPRSAAAAAAAGGGGGGGGSPAQRYQRAVPAMQKAFDRANRVLHTYADAQRVAVTAFFGAVPLTSSATAPLSAAAPNPTPSSSVAACILLPELVSVVCQYLAPRSQKQFVL